MEVSLIQVVQVLVLPVLGFFWWEFRTFRQETREDLKSLHKRVTENNKEQSEAIESTKRHILGCANFTPKQGAESLIK